MPPSTPPPFDLSGHVALVTGANHGIGAATAHTLAACGARVAISYLRLDDAPDPGIPELYRENRASDAEDVLADIRAANGHPRSRRTSPIRRRPVVCSMLPRRSSARSTSS